MLHEVPRGLHYAVGDVPDVLRENGYDCFDVASPDDFGFDDYRDDDAPFPAGKEPWRMVRDTLRTDIMQLRSKGKVDLSVREKEGVDRGERLGEKGCLYLLLQNKRCSPAAHDCPAIVQYVVLEQVRDLLRYQLEIAQDHSSMIPY